MADNTVRSKYEEMDAVYSDFAKAIGKFSDDVYHNADQILRTVDSIGDQWSNNGYLDFKENISGRIDNIKRLLQRCDAIKTSIDKASEKIKIVIEKLRETE